MRAAKQERESASTQREIAANKRKERERKGKKRKEKRLSLAPRHGMALHRNARRVESREREPRAERRDARAAGSLSLGINDPSRRDVSLERRRRERGLSLPRSSLVARREKAPLGFFFVSFVRALGQPTSYTLRLPASPAPRPRVPCTGRLFSEARVWVQSREETRGF